MEDRSLIYSEGILSARLY